MLPLPLPLSLPFAFRLSPFAFRLSPFASRLSPLASRLFASFLLLSLILFLPMFACSVCFTFLPLCPFALAVAHSKLLDFGKQLLLRKADILISSPPSCVFSARFFTSFVVRDELVSTSDTGNLSSKYLTNDARRSAYVLNDLLVNTPASPNNAQALLISMREFSHPRQSSWPMPAVRSSRLATYSSVEVTGHLLPRFEPRSFRYAHVVLLRSFCAYNGENDIQLSVHLLEGHPQFLDSLHRS